MDLFVLASSLIGAGLVGWGAWALALGVLNARPAASAPKPRREGSLAILRSKFSRIEVQARGILPRLRKSRRDKWKLEKMRELFPQSLGMAVQALKAGQTLPQTLEYLSRESPSPLREEWVQACSEMDLGASAEEALARMEGRYPGFADFESFLQSYKISRKTGANLTQLLKVLLDGIGERDRLARKMESLTAQARLSGILMGLLPFVLVFVFFVMDPGLLAPLVTEKAGWGILVLSFGMEAVGFWWIRQLLRIEA